MILAGADKLIGMEDRATLESAPSAMPEVKPSAPASLSIGFASQSENSRRRRNPSARSADPAPSSPNLYNMGGLNPEKSIDTGFSDNWCGLDWLTLSFWINWGADWAADTSKEKNWQGGCEKETIGMEIRAALDAGQISAMAKGEPIELPNMGGAMIHPGGGKIAKKYCRFKIELESATILIADQPGYNGDWPNVKVEISGFDCLCYTGGAPEAYRAAMQWIDQHLGGEIHKERVSRVDLCADFPGWSMNQFIESAEKRHWTCRSRVYHPYLCAGATSLYWGTGALILRVYDKLGEMRASALRGAPAKYEHMIKKRWGGVEPDQALRVEYQLRRDALKGFGITDFDSLANGHGDLVRYLTGKGATLIRWSDTQQRKTKQDEARWFRFLTWQPDPKHPENNHTLPRWEQVQAVFCDRFLCPEPMEEIQPENSNIETLLKQMFGVGETAARERGYDIPGKKTAAPAKFHFEYYEDFEEWVNIQLRIIAIQKSGWRFRRTHQD